MVRGMDMSSILDSMMEVLPYMKQITGQDCLVGLCDMEKCVGLWEADSFKLKTGIRPGQSVDKFSFITTVLNSGKASVEKLPAEVLGTPILDIIQPLKEEGRVVGAVLFSSSRVEQTKIQESSKSLNDNLTDTNERINEAAEGIRELADTLNNLKEASDNLAKQTGIVSELIKGIQQTASKSNILALNAAIEAARVGDAGRGFAVVADEMGKLAKISGNSAKEISTTLGDIFDKLRDVTASLNRANDVASNQSQVISHINATVADITEASLGLAEFASNQ